MDKHPHITLINKMVPFVFVIPPTDLRISQSQNHKPIEIIDLGEILKIFPIKTLFPSTTNSISCPSSNFALSFK